MDIFWKIRGIGVRLGEKIFWLAKELNVRFFFADATGPSSTERLSSSPSAGSLPKQWTCRCGRMCMDLEFQTVLSVSE
jgi:hypothetical protein